MTAGFNLADASEVWVTDSEGVATLVEEINVTDDASAPATVWRGLPDPITFTYRTAGTHTIVVPPEFKRFTVESVVVGGGGGGGGGGNANGGEGGKTTSSVITQTLALDQHSNITASVGAGGNPIPHASGYPQPGGPGGPSQVTATGMVGTVSPGGAGGRINDAYTSYPMPGETLPNATHFEVLHDFGTSGAGGTGGESQSGEGLPGYPGYVWVRLTAH